MQPVAENPTQAMVEPAYRHYDLDWRYLTIEVAPEDLEAAVEVALVMGFGGFNLTIPHKVAVMEHLDEIGESATLIGAVNCVVRRGEKLVWENTDDKGFLEFLKERTNQTVNFSSVDPKTSIADVIPNPPRTLFLQRAEERGCETIYGLGMLVNQGRIGITYWSGVDPDTSVMRNALEEVFGGD